MQRIKIDRTKCVGCLTCTTACMVSHNSEDTRTRIVIDDQNKYAPIFCRHCDLPECVYTCMSGAMTKNPKTGLVDYDKDRCAHCYMCIMACPYGVLKMDSRTQSEVMKCNACQHLESKTPQCVLRCPMGAITLVEVD